MVCFKEFYGVGGVGLSSGAYGTSGGGVDASVGVATCGVAKWNFRQFLHL